MITSALKTKARKLGIRLSYPSGTKKSESTLRQNIRTKLLRKRKRNQRATKKKLKSRSRASSYGGIYGHGMRGASFEPMDFYNIPAKIPLGNANMIRYPYVNW